MRSDSGVCVCVGVGGVGGCGRGATPTTNLRMHNQSHFLHAVRSIVKFVSSICTCSSSIVLVEALTVISSLLTFMYVVIIRKLAFDRFHIYKR